MRDKNWLTKIPPSPSHGSNLLQQRYWRVVSDFVRIRDFEKYGACIACGKRFNSWKESQAGHYKSWAVCRWFSKYDTKNIFAECAYCNTGFKGNEVGANFKEGIIRRYGKKRITYIDELTKYPTEKLDEDRIIEGIKSTIKKLSTVKEKPDYFSKIKWAIGRKQKTCK